MKTVCCVQADQSRLFIPAANPFSGSLTSASAIPVAFKPRQKPPPLSEAAEKGVGPSSLPLKPSWAAPRASAKRTYGAVSAELEIPGLAPTPDDEQPSTSKQSIFAAAGDSSQSHSHRAQFLEGGTVSDPATSKVEGQDFNVQFFLSPSLQSLEEGVITRKD